MPNLSNHQSSSELVKLLFIGDSGTAKTGALVSLVKAGYHLRIIDFDNGLDALVHQIKQQCPELLSTVEYETCQDKYKTTRTGRPYSQVCQQHYPALENTSTAGLTVPSPSGGRRKS